MAKKPKRASAPAGNEERMSSIEAAKYLGCSVSGLNYRRISGRIGDIIEVNGRKRYLRSALDAYIEKYGRGNVKRRTLSEEEEKAVKNAASAFISRAKKILREATEMLNKELESTFRSYPYNAARLAELIRSHIHLSRRLPFVKSGSVGTFLSCDFQKLCATEQVPADGND